MATFEELVAEGAAVPVEGWDFSGLQVERTAGGGEVLAAVAKPPPVLVATEGWAPNAALAQQRLAPLGGVVVQVGENADLPFADDSFDLVVSRHPVTVRWEEVARVLARCASSPTS